MDSGASRGGGGAVFYRIIPRSGDQCFLPVGPGGQKGRDGVMSGNISGHNRP